MPPGTSELFLLELALELRVAVPFFPFAFGEEESLLSPAASKLPGITVERPTSVPFPSGIGRGERE